LYNIIVALSIEKRNGTGGGFAAIRQAQPA